MGNSLSDHLAGTGYSRIDLRRSVTGQLVIDARLGPADLSLIVDSGASATVLDATSADRAGLTRHEARDCGIGAGGRVEAFTAHVEQLALGETDVHLESVSVMNLHHVNERLTAMGEHRVDGVIGADVLRGHGAVIEYDTPALYLRAVTSQP